MRPKNPNNRKASRVRTLRRMTQTDNPRKNLRRFKRLSERGKTGLSIGMDRAYGKVLENRLKKAEADKARKLRLKAKSAAKKNQEKVKAKIRKPKVTPKPKPITHPLNPRKPKPGGRRPVGILNKKNPVTRNFMNKLVGGGRKSQPKKGKGL
mgnify:CR=1 FL=1|tara:strand:- start:43 stop:498 length:456 start_codon:yes stop_codon:yes gene_type:complete